VRFCHHSSLVLSCLCLSPLLFQVLIDAFFGTLLPSFHCFLNQSLNSHFFFRFINICFQFNLLCTHCLSFLILPQERTDVFLPCVCEVPNEFPLPFKGFLIHFFYSRFFISGWWLWLLLLLGTLFCLFCLSLFVADVLVHEGRAQEFFERD